MEYHVHDAMLFFSRAWPHCDGILSAGCSLLFLFVRISSYALFLSPCPSFSPSNDCIFDVFFYLVYLILTSALIRHVVSFFFSGSFHPILHNSIHLETRKHAPVFIFFLHLSHLPWFLLYWIMDTFLKCSAELHVDYVVDARAKT